MRDEANLARAAGPMTALSAEDRMLAATLQHAVYELQATTGTAMVPLEGGRALANIIVVGDPLSVFTVADRHPVDDDRYTGAVAYRTGRQCVRVRSETPSGVRPAMPFPYAMVATPLTDDEGRSFGVIVLVWADPVGWAAKSARVRHRCKSLVAELSRALLRRGGLPPRRHFPGVPRFILARPTGEDALLESVSLSLVYQIGRLSAELSQAPGLRDVVETAIARIMEPFGARCLAISVVDEGRPRLLGYEGVGPALAARLVNASTGTLEEETSNDAGPSPPDRPLFFEAVDTDEPITAYCLLPLAIDDHTAGTLALGFDHRHTFKADERAALTRMAQLLAQAIGRARQFETERRLAQELQQSLLPPALPQHSEMDIAARYVTPTTGTVGGDWYDVINLPDGGIGLVTGDVEGHSPRAATTMGQIRSAVRAYAAEGHRPADVLTRTNRLLSDLGTDLLATCCCVWLDPEAETVEISSAGHPAPLLGHPGSPFAAPELPLGIPLGVRPDTCYGSGQAPLREGTVLVLYTDGLVRSHSVPLGDGIEALHARLATSGDLRLEVLADHLLEITGGNRRDDDAAVLIAQFLGLGADRSQRVARTFVHRHDLRAVADVRRFLRAQARSWDWEAVIPDLELAVTELVTNGLVHADSKVEVRLREYADHLRVDVRDSDPRPPLPAPVLTSGGTDDESEHGRGLLIVDALAASWGNSPSGRGKSVWFELTRPTASAKPES
ncbi:SpoIIE family protein phosphatase [Streptomyces sp. SAI-127]|uniref:ATP-binding SpoIIE family protein phosphatase n=1 Tax=Streptomyces sp. SAI-127 TaxID=2940543 RepID=UPI0024742F7B|nr:SpoIIE family protein phosphatase [Streptomyces sp. SAI-127]MDH6493406.1 serine phosphatase RsbU (regulator of sigma subunit)/anti-sigma regulatory factor (Ser/Thr protein kinase) [Streptomyces sp. SAI-127]